MIALNEVRLFGRATREPELRRTGAGTAVTDIRLAVACRNRGPTTFLGVRVWGELAERCVGVVKKGYPLYVEGEARMDEWEAEGKTRTKIYVKATAVGFMGHLMGERQDDAEPEGVEE